MFSTGADFGSEFARSVRLIALSWPPATWRRTARAAGRRWTRQRQRPFRFAPSRSHSDPPFPRRCVRAPVSRKKRISGGGHGRSDARESLMRTRWLSHQKMHRERLVRRALQSSGHHSSALQSCAKFGLPLLTVGAAPPGADALKMPAALREDQRARHGQERAQARPRGKDRARPHPSQPHPLQHPSNTPPTPLQHPSPPSDTPPPLQHPSNTPPTPLQGPPVLSQYVTLPRCLHFSRGFFSPLSLCILIFLRLLFHTCSW